MESNSEYQINHIYTKNETHPRIIPNDNQLEFIQFEKLHLSVYPTIPEKRIEETNDSNESEECDKSEEEINKEKEVIEERKQKKQPRSITDRLFGDK